MTGSDTRRMAEALLPLLRAALGGVETRTTGETIGLMLHGTVFGMIQDGALLFRVDALTRGDYDAAAGRPGPAADDPAEDGAGAAALDPPGGGALAVAAFRRVPPFVLDDEDRLAVWGRKAWEAARRARAAAPA